MASYYIIIRGGKRAGTKGKLLHFAEFGAIVTNFVFSNFRLENAVKLVYNDHPWKQKLWALLTGDRCSEYIHIIKVRIGTSYCGRYGQVVTIWRRSLSQL